MKKKVLSFFIMLLMLISLAAPSIRLYAAPEDENGQEEEKVREAYFAAIEEGDTFLVYAEWEKTQPAIKFRSPSGAIYDTNEKKEGTHLSLGDGQLYYQIDEPEPGDWYVIYDKKDNDTITIDLEVVTKPMIIKDIKVSNITGSDALVSFMVDFQDYIGVNYKISIAAGNNTGEVVYEGYTYTNEEVDARVDLSRFGSSDKYRVYIYAYYMRDGGEIGEGAFSDTFSFSNSNVVAMQTPVALTLEPDSFTVKVDLDRYYNYEYLIAYYTDNKTEPDFFMEVEDGDSRSIDYVYDVNATSLRVEISEKRYNGAYSLPKKYTIDLTKLPKITFEGEELTNKRFIAYSYSGFEPKTIITIVVNETKGEYMLSLADGSMTAALNDSYNAVSVSFTQAQDVTVLYKTEIYMDIEPPRIYMLQDYTDVKVSGKSYNVLGTVTGADSFTIGGKNVALKNDGTFAFSLDLKKGENVFLAEAKDKAGNIAVYTITVTSADLAPTPTPAAGAAGPGDSSNSSEKGAGATLLSFLPAVIAALLGIALVVVVLVQGRKEKASSLFGNLRKIIIFLGALGLIFTGYSTFNFVKTNLFVNSTKFIDLAYESIDEAGEYLHQLSFWKNMTIAGAVELGVCVVAIVVVTVIAKVKKK